MRPTTTKRYLAAVAATAAIGLVAGLAATVGVAGTGDAPATRPTGTHAGDGSVPFWPYETGAMGGTSETYTDVREDGSYYDPSLGRRISGGSRWQFSPNEPGAMGGTSETYTDVQDDGSYYDPSLERRVSPRR